MFDLNVSSMAFSQPATRAEHASSPLDSAQAPAQSLATEPVDVLLHHLPAKEGEILHVYVDGEYFRGVALVQGCTQTYVHVGAECWRATGAVHAIDAYQASASGRVLEHQSMLVTTAAHSSLGSAASHCAVGSAEWAAALGSEVDVVEYRISREGLPFGDWHADYREPAVDGRDDGSYVVQMRFLDAQQRVMDVQTVAFLVRDGVVVHA